MSTGIRPAVVPDDWLACVLGLGFRRGRGAWGLRQAHGHNQPGDWPVAVVAHLKLRRTIVGVAQWYASLSPVAQVILALALLALVGVPWRDTILVGLKIVFSK